MLPPLAIAYILVGTSALGPRAPISWPRAKPSCPLPPEQARRPVRQRARPEPGRCRHAPGADPNWDWSGPSPPWKTSGTRPTPKAGNTVSRPSTFPSWRWWKRERKAAAAWSRAQRRKDEDFLAAPSCRTALLVWAARFWDSLFSFLPTGPASSGVPRVLAMYRRAAELDPSCHGGNPLWGRFWPGSATTGSSGPPWAGPSPASSRPLRWARTTSPTALPMPGPTPWGQGRQALRPVGGPRARPPGGNWPFWDEYPRDQALRLGHRRDPYFPPG